MTACELLTTGQTQTRHEQQWVTSAQTDPHTPTPHNTTPPAWCGREGGRGDPPRVLSASPNPNDPAEDYNITAPTWHFLMDLIPVRGTLANHCFYDHSIITEYYVPYGYDYARDLYGGRFENVYKVCLSLWINRSGARAHFHTVHK